MALVVENGDGLVDAESYISVADADAYHTRFGNTAWTGSDSAKEMALRKAARYIDLKYGQRWYGQRSSKEQGLAWPRIGVIDRDGYQFDNDELPTDLEKANAEAGLVCLSEDPLADVTADESGNIKAETIKVGPIEITEQYMGAKSTSKKYVKVDTLLRSITTGPGETERG